MKRRPFISGATTIATVGSLAGCVGLFGDGDGQGSATRPRELESWPPDEYNKTCHCWSWYADWQEWGTQAFKENYDMNEVTANAVANPAKWYGALEAGRAENDVIVTNNEWVGRALNNDYVESLPVDAIPAWDTVREDYIQDMRDHFPSQGDGLFPAIPFTVNISPVLAYHTEYFDEPPTSWSEMWNDEHKGDIAMFAPRPEVACYLGAFYTGQDPFNPSDYEAIKEALIQQKPLNKTIQDSNQGMQQMLANESVRLCNFRDGRVFKAIFDQDAPYDFVIPEEGSMYSPNVFFVPTVSDNPMAGLMYLNFMMDDKAMRKFVEITRYRPARSNEGIRNLLEGHEDPELIDKMVLDEEDIENTVFSAPLEDGVLERYDEIWTEVKAA